MTQAQAGTILAATDLSDHGDEAVRQAHEWAERVSGQLVVVHGLEDPTPLFAPMGEMQQMSAALMTTKKEMVTTLAERVETLLGKRVPCEVHIGSPQNVVVRAAERHDAALVVVGGTGRGRMEQLFLGSTAEEVLRHAPTDVLIARPGPKEGDIIACSDLSELSHLAVQAAADEAERRDAPLRVLHALDIAHPVLAAFEPLLVVDDETRRGLHDACREVLESQLERTGGKGTVEVVEGRPSRVIAAALEDGDASLVVIATHGHTGFKRLALGSVASAIARRATTSVLVVRVPKHG